MPHIQCQATSLEAVHVHTAKTEDDKEYSKTIGRADRLKLLSLKASMDSPDDMTLAPVLLSALLSRSVWQQSLPMTLLVLNPLLTFNKTIHSPLHFDEPSLRQKNGSFHAAHEKHFESLHSRPFIFVGENALLTRGAQALYDLAPQQFHQIFSPLVASMGDAETLVSRLASTEVLVDKYLSDERILTEETLCKGHQKMTVASKTVKMPVNQATAMFE
jgi:hypothetical protein